MNDTFQKNKVPRLLVTRRATGLGSDLASAIGCWHHAAQCGRDLLIDWSRSRYCPDPSINLFSELFQLRSREVDGVRIMIADESEGLPEPVAEITEPNASYTRVSSLLEDDGIATVINPHNAHILPSEDIQRRFLSNLLPIDSVADTAADFREIHFREWVVAGVHIRHGNGENLMGQNAPNGVGRNSTMKEHQEVILDRVRRAIDLLAIRFPNRVKLFIATDSCEIENSLKSLPYPSVSTAKTLRKEGSGPLHIRSLGLEGARHALGDMLLLSHCDFLFHNSSWFTHLPRILGNSTSQPLNVTPEVLYASPQFYPSAASSGITPTA